MKTLLLLCATLFCMSIGSGKEITYIVKDGQGFGSTNAVPGSNVKYIFNNKQGEKSPSTGGDVKYVYYEGQGHGPSNGNDIIIDYGNQGNGGTHVINITLEGGEGVGFSATGSLSFMSQRSKPRHLNQTWSFFYNNWDWIVEGSWYTVYSDCAVKDGPLSPLYLYKVYATYDETAYVNFTFHGNPKNAQVIAFNDGRYLRLFPRTESGGYAVSVTNPDILPATYHLDQIKLHWSLYDTTGSEHPVEGIRYAAEAEMVFFNSKFGDYEKAKSKQEGLVHVSLIFQVGQSNPVLLNVLQEFPKFSIEGMYERFGGFNLEKLIPRSRLFFRYYGTQTQPPCSHNVQRFIFLHREYIGNEELRILRTEIKAYHKTGGTTYNIFANSRWDAYGQGNRQVWRNFN